MSGPVGQKTAPTCFAHAKRVALWRGVLRWVGCDGSLHDSFPRRFAHAFSPSRFAALQHARNPWPAPCRRSSQQWSALCRLGHTYQLTGTITEYDGRGWIVARRYSVMALSPEAPARSEEVGWPLAVHACSVCDGGYCAVGCATGTWMTSSWSTSWWRVTRRAQQRLHTRQDFQVRCCHG